MNPNPPKINGEEAMRKVFATAETRSYRTGDVIFAEGQEDPNFYLIQKGAVEISRKSDEGRPRVVSDLKAGDFIGEAVLGGETLKPSTAKALRDSVLLALPAAQFMEMTQKEPLIVIDFLLYALRTTNKRLNHTSARLVALSEISRLLDQCRGDLAGLSKGLVDRLVAVTHSKDGLLCLKSEYSQECRTVYTTDPMWTDRDLAALWAVGSKILEIPPNALLIVDLRGLGFVALRRPLEAGLYEEDHLKFVELVAELTSGTVRDASDQASEKAKKMLERKVFEF